ncbi:ankyrin repeat domain-containing protein [Aspergillus lucknowensis]|uniref:Ankyrin repeat-containing domain protein n=1 Tax=Aspergillus lucknowensis TaxID=176173 RepID=A0ABR4LY64_9EURO
MPILLSNFPSELIFLIAHSLEFDSNLNALSRVNRRFHELLNPLLYSTYARYEDPLVWAASQGMRETLLKFLAAGGVPNQEVMSAALDNGHPELVELLYRRCVGPDGGNGVRENLFLDAAQAGHASLVRFLIQSGVHPDYRVRWRNSPLEAAAENGHLPVLKALLDAGCSLELAWAAHTTPLDLAAKRGHTDIVRFFLERGMPVNKALPTEWWWDGSHYDWWPLDFAACYGPIDTIRCLLENGAGPSPNMLLAPASYARGDVVKLLTQHFNYPKAVTTVTMHSMKRYIVMRLTRIALAAAACGLTDLLAETIAHGWDVHSPVIRGYDPRIYNTRGTPLAWAARNGQLQTLLMLLEKGADPDGNVGVEKGVMNPLHYAVMRGHAEIVSALLNYGAWLNPHCVVPSALDDAVSHPQIFKMLLSRRPALLSPSIGTRNLLGVKAIRQGQSEVVQMLIAKGVNFLHPSLHPRGGSLLKLLAESNEAVLTTLPRKKFKPRPGGPDEKDILLAGASHGNIPFLQFLISRGFNISHPQWQADLLLHAVTGRNRERVEPTLDFLLAQGLDINARNAELRTALLELLDAKHTAATPRLAELLVKRGADPSLSCVGLCPIVAAARGVHMGGYGWYSGSLGRILKPLLRGIEARGTPFEVVGPQLLEAISVLTAKGEDEEEEEEDYGYVRPTDALRVLRQFYWRKRYPV